MPVPKRGDHVSIRRGLNRHHMLVVKVKRIVKDCFLLTVIHVTKKATGCRIKEELLQELVEADDLLVHDNYHCKYSGDEAIERARVMSKLKNSRYSYNLLTNNCEHFVRLAKTGKKKCRQIEQVGVAAGGGVGGVAAGGGIGAVIGGIVGTLIPIPVIGTAAGAAIGGAIGAGSGGIVVGAVGYTAKRVYDEKKKK